MKFSKVVIDGIVVIEPTVFVDKRGSFLESYNKNEFEKVIEGIAQLEGKDALVVSLEGIPDVDAEPESFQEHYDIFKDMASYVDGKYTIKPIDPGRYTVKVSFIGFATKEISDVLISSNKITFIKAALKIESDVLGEVELVEYVVPLIDPDKTGTTKTKERNRRNREKSDMYP